jgi:hypothetical protein
LPHATRVTANKAAKATPESFLTCIFSPDDCRV